MVLHVYDYTAIQYKPFKVFKLQVSKKYFNFNTKK